MTILLCDANYQNVRLSTRPPSDRDNEDPHADLFHQRAMTAGSAFYDALSQVLRRRLRGPGIFGSLGAIFNVVGDTLLSFLDPLARLFMDAQLASWIGGAGRVAEQLPAEPPPGDLAGPPFFPPPEWPTVSGDSEEWRWPGMKVWLPLVENAVQDLQQRQLVTRPQFDRLEGAARAQAFTVANLETNEAIGQVRDAVTEAVAKGGTLKEFTKDVDEALGESTLGPGHMETVFRTNIAQVYHDGAESIASHPIIAPSFPYRMRMPIRDSRLTELCLILARSGLNGGPIYRADDPFYLRSCPPSHYGCRCGVRFLSVQDAAERGVKEAQRWLDSGQPPITPEWVTPPDVQFPAGWNPGGRPMRLVA